MQPEKNYDLVLSTLLRHGVEFIVVGGVSAVLHGAPYDTFDVDVVHARAAKNLERLVDALEELDAVYRMMMSRRLRPPLSALEGPGHQLLMTRHGPLDVLGAIDDGMGYEELVDHTVNVRISEKESVKVLDLETLIAVKRRAGRAKDMWAVELLEAVRAEKERIQAAKRGG